MINEQLIHDWMVVYLKEKLSRSYDKVLINLADKKENEFNGIYPDLILSNHGLVMSIIQVETDQGITEANSETWKGLAGKGAKLILMVPKKHKARTIDLLWHSGLADKASIGSYELNVTMP
ncbi:MAG: hypothetical protein ISR96_04000 [Nitrospira sp.]|nr:hypothetical protein [bacterium]MBL7048676.1 hypothetical protein [Nitrospira sp.]